MTPSNKNNSTVSVMHKKHDDLNLCQLLLSKYFNKKKWNKLSAQVEYIKEFSKIWTGSVLQRCWYFRIKTKWISSKLPVDIYIYSLDCLSDSVLIYKRPKGHIPHLSNNTFNSDQIK